MQNPVTRTLDSLEIGIIAAEIGRHGRESKYVAQVLAMAIERRFVGGRDAPSDASILDALWRAADEIMANREKPL